MEFAATGLHVWSTFTSRPSQTNSTFTFGIIIQYVRNNESSIHGVSKLGMMGGIRVLAMAVIECLNEWALFLPTITAVIIIERH